MIPDTDKLKRYDDLANLVEELHDENMRLRGRARYPDIASLVAELRRQAAARHAIQCLRQLPLVAIRPNFRLWADRSTIVAVIRASRRRRTAHPVGSRARPGWSS